MISKSACFLSKEEQIFIITCLGVEIIDISVIPTGQKKKIRYEYKADNLDWW